MWPFKQNRNLTEYSCYDAIKNRHYFFKIYLLVKTKSKFKYYLTALNGLLTQTRVRTLVNTLLMIQYRAVSLFCRLDARVKPDWYLFCLSSCLSFLVKVKSYIWVVVRIRAWILTNELSGSINKQTEIWTKSSHQIITRQTVYVVLYSDCLIDNQSYPSIKLSITLEFTRLSFI